MIMMICFKMAKYAVVCHKKYWIFGQQFRRDNILHADQVVIQNLYKLFILYLNK